MLREDILVGRRAPGSRLVERDIAAELHVSRLPVREAIRALVAEGIVVARPRSWAVVCEFTMQDVQDFAEVRETLELQVFLLAAERHDEEGLRRLRAALDREAAAAASGDIVEARLAAGEFHLAAVDMAGNEMMRELIGVFVTRLRWLFGQHDDAEAMVREHERIYEAIVRRDIEALRTLVAEHLAVGRRIAERRLQARTELASEDA